MKIKLKEQKQIRKTFDLPLKLNLYFSMLENTLEQNLKNIPFFSTKKYEQPIAQIFLKAFQEQKIGYLHQMITFIKNHIENEGQSEIEQKLGSQKYISTVQDLIHTIETSAFMQQSVIKLPYWDQVRFKFNKMQRCVDIISNKRNFRINLAFYLIRKSHNIDQCIVFQTLRQQNDTIKTVHLTFHKQIFQKIWQELYKSIIKCRKQQLLQMMKQEEKENIQKNSPNNKCQTIKQKNTQNKTLVFLSTKSIKTYQKFKETVMKRLLMGKLQFKSLLSQELQDHPYMKTFKIQQSLKAQNLFKLEIILLKPCAQAKQQFIQGYKSKFKYKLLSSVLKQNNKYQALYEKFLFKNNKVHQVISIRQGYIQETQQILFVKGVEHIISKDHIQFITARVVKINENQCRVIVIGSFFLNEFLDVDLITKYLLEFKDMLYRQKRKVSVYENANEDNMSEQQFYTICNDQLSYQDIELEQGQTNSFQSAEQDSPKNDLNTNPLKLGIKQSQDQHKIQLEKEKVNSLTMSSQKINSYLDVYHSVHCLQRTNLIMKEHYLYKDWTRTKSGGVVCYNQAIINQQKKIVKKLITRMGSSLIKGNGIVNMSLPVDIFKKQSQLTSIGRDFCYAPRFIQKGIKSESKLQRIKYASLLAISVGNLGVSLEKPFNPILGQTLQCWIDNCPIYLQQISHHPPISAYFMVGRGFKIDGQIQTKISLGMNTVKGYSQKPNHIIFDDGTKMTMVYGKMLIKGTLFGQRQFKFQDKIFVYDQTNNIFSEIAYGPRKDSKDPEDFISGKIYELQTNFKSKFYASKQNLYPSPYDIIKQLSKFEGVWTQSLKFDGVQYVNFKTELPHDLIEQKYSLPSNPSNRMDLKKLIGNKIQQSQRNKDLMQEQQRKDKRLRQKYTKKN